MAPAIAGKNVPVAAAVAAVGGLLAIVSAPLTWASATVSGQTQSVGGLDKDYMNGKAEILLGIVVLALVAAWILNLKVPSIGIIVIVVGVAILAVPIATYFTTLIYPLSLKDTADQMTALGGSATFGIGFILAAVGGILAIVGGAMSVFKKA